MVRGISEHPYQRCSNKETKRKNFIWRAKSSFIDNSVEVGKNKSKRINTMVHIHRRQRQKLFWIYTDNHDR